MTFAPPDTVTRRLIDRTHPDYSARFEELRFYRESYEGSGAYAPYLDPIAVSDTWSDDLKSGSVGPDESRRTHLFRHTRERAKFKRRVAMAYATNVIKRTTQMISGYLSKAQPNYSQYPTQVEEWMGYATAAGDTWEDFKTSEILPRVLYYGALPVIVFREPTPEAETEAQQLEDGGMVQVSYIDPETIVDWRTNRAGQFVWLRHVEEIDLSGPLDEKPRVIKRWWWHTQEGWWYVDDDGKGTNELPVTASGAYDDGMPIVVWRLGTSGQSLIADAAPTQRELYNVNSLIQEQERETTFAMLAAPGDGPKPGTKKVSSDNVWWYPVESRVAPHWMAPPPHILEHFMAKADVLARQILEDMGLDFDASGGSTGMALQFKMSKIVRLLNMLATSMQRGESQTLEVVASQLKAEIPDDARCVWPSEFDAKDAEKVVEMLSVLLDRISSKTFKVEAQYRMAIAAMPDMDEGMRSDGREEIEEAVEREESEADTGADELPEDDLMPAAPASPFAPPNQGNAQGVPDGSAR